MKLKRCVEKVLKDWKKGANEGIESERSVQRKYHDTL